MNFDDEFEKEIEPEKAPLVKVELKETHNHIIAKSENNNNYSQPFNFSSKWLNQYNQVVFNHTTSGYNQIEIKTLQNIAYLFSYAGLRTEPFFILDLCDSGRGKTSNIKLQSELLLSPIYAIQEENLKEDILRHEIDIREAKGKDKELVQAPSLHKCIHSSDVSKEALFESFETVQSQLLEFGEFGQRLKNRNDGLIDYIIDGYGAKSIKAPAYKNQRYSKTLKVDGISLSFIGDTTLTYLGKKNFFEHLQGGLINRCILIYDDYLPNYDDYPQNYNVNLDTKEFYNNIAINVIEFAKDNAHFKGIDYNYTKSKILKAYEKNIVLQKNEYYLQIISLGIYTIEQFKTLEH